MGLRDDAPFFIGATDNGFGNTQVKNTILAEANTFRQEASFGFSEIHPLPPAYLHGRPEIQQWLAEHGAEFGYPGGPEWVLQKTDDYADWCDANGFGFALRAIITKNPGANSWVKALPMADARLELRRHANFLVDRYVPRPSVYRIIIGNEMFHSGGNLNPNHYWAFGSIAEYRNTIVSVIKTIRTRIKNQHGNKEIDLLVNDFGGEYNEIWPGKTQGKATGMYYEMREWELRGAKIDTWGAQWHLWMHPDPATEPVGQRHVSMEQARDVLIAFHNAGYKTAITELDVAIAGTSDPASLYERQADIYRDIATAAVQSGPMHTEVCFWGLDDKNWRWYPFYGNPLTDPTIHHDRTEQVCGDYLCRKPAYYGFQEGLA